MIFSKKSDSQRDLAIAFKQFFGTAQGKEVLYYLMNRYHIISPCKSDVEEGQRQVVIDIMTRSNIDIKRLDELLKGESNE